MTLRHPFSDAVVGFLIGIAFMLVLIQAWGLTWLRLIAPGWSPGL